MTSSCAALWFNDQEADHVHRCSYRPGHDSYHWCGYDYHNRDVEAKDGLPLLCGISWEPIEASDD